MNKKALIFALGLSTFVFAGDCEILENGNLLCKNLKEDDITIHAVFVKNTNILAEYRLHNSGVKTFMLSNCPNSFLDEDGKFCQGRIPKERIGCSDNHTLTEYFDEYGIETGEKFEKKKADNYCYDKFRKYLE